jgi:ABC-type dipeptide/oligopeptide/nickel transport system permease subunit
LRETQFVEAAQSIGAPTRWILFREILPNLVAPIIVYTTLIIPVNIIAEASLSFLGVGVNEPAAAWGTMLSRATNFAAFGAAWWYMAFPGLALFITVLGFNLLGDGLRDALDPRTKA